MTKSSGFRRSVAAATALATAASLLGVAPSALAAGGGPKVNTVAPSSGASAGGSTVKVIGSGFSHVSRVLFGSTVGTKVRVVSSRQLTVRAPRHAAGTTDVRIVTKSGGTHTSPKSASDHFRYVAAPVVRSVSPASGPLTGGRTVTVSGAGFTKITKVAFGTKPGTRVKVSSATKLTVITPAHAEQLVDVRVTGAYGTSAVTTKDRFRYVAAGPPGAVTKVAAKVTASSVDLSWVNPTSANLAGVLVRRANGVKAPATPAAGTSLGNQATYTTSLSDTGLTAATTYSYALFAHNSAGAFSAAAVITVTTSASQAPSRYSLSVLAGVNRTVLAGPATSAPLGANSVAVDDLGNTYVADQVNDVIEKVTPAGDLSIVAGRVAVAGTPIPGPATSTSLLSPQAVAVDGSGDVFIADTRFVEKIDSAGQLSIVAGGGVLPPSTTGRAAATIDLEASDVAVGADGSIYIGNAGNLTVDRLTSTGTLSVIAGNGHRGAPTAGPATKSSFGSRFTGGRLQVAPDTNGDVYVSDTENGVVAKVSKAGTLTILKRGLEDSFGLAVQPNHDVLVAVSDGGDSSTVDRITPSGALTVVAGGGSSTTLSGDATSLALGNPRDVAVTTAGGFVIADLGNSVIESVTASGALSVVAGRESAGDPTPGPASASQLNGPSATAVDADGNVYIADQSYVEKVTPDGTLSVIAGGGTHGVRPGAATQSELSGPDGLAVDSAGNVYIADSYNYRVEKVTPAGQLSVLAGNGQYSSPDPGPAVDSPVGFPNGVAVDSAGNVYISDELSSVIEKVTPGGTLSVVAGRVGQNGTPTNGPATSRDLGDPQGVAVNSAGNVYIADEAGYVEKVTPGGALTVIGGNGVTNQAPRAGPALNSPMEADGVAVDSVGNVFLPMTYQDSIVEIDTTGTLSVVAGNGMSSPPTPGDAAASGFNVIPDVAVGPGGQLYVADFDNNDVEQLSQ